LTWTCAPQIPELDLGVLVLRGGTEKAEDGRGREARYEDKKTEGEEQG